MVKRKTKSRKRKSRRKKRSTKKIDYGFEYPKNNKSFIEIMEKIKDYPPARKEGIILYNIIKNLFLPVNVYFESDTLFGINFKVGKNEYHCLIESFSGNSPVFHLNYVIFHKDNTFTDHILATDYLNEINNLEKIVEDKKDPEFTSIINNTEYIIEHDTIEGKPIFYIYKKEKNQRDFNTIDEVLEFLKLE